MADEIRTAEELNALIDQPAAISVQGQNTTLRPLPDVIAMDKHVANKTYGGNGWMSVGKAVVIPPSSTNENDANA